MYVKKIFVRIRIYNFLLIVVTIGFDKLLFMENIQTEIELGDVILFAI